MFDVICPMPDDYFIKTVFSEDISDLLQALEKRREHVVPSHAGLWAPGWPFTKKSAPGPGNSKRDYVPDATIAVSSAFVSALAPVFCRHGGSYRATLHRIVAMPGDSEVHLQQVAHYHGPRASEKSQKPNVIGRLFKITDAVIGLAARTGLILYTRALKRPVGETKQLLHKDMQRLNGDTWDPQRMDEEVSALFACPLIGSSDSDPGPLTDRRVVAVLFADSTAVAAFDDYTVTEIVAACEEFGRYLQRIARSEVPELISVKSQATSYPLPTVTSATDVFDELSILQASSSTAPRVGIEYLNLEWSDLEWSELMPPSGTGAPTAAAKSRGGQNANV